MKRHVLTVCLALLLTGSLSVLQAQSFKDVILEKTQEAGLSVEEATDDYVKLTFDMPRGTTQTVIISQATEGEFMISLVEIDIPSFRTSEMTDDEVTTLAIAMMRSNTGYGSGFWVIEGDDPYFAFMHNIPGDVLVTYSGERLRSIIEYMVSVVDDFEAGLQSYMAENRGDATRGGPGGGMTLDAVISGFNRSTKSGGPGGGMTLEK
ncbi:MAG: hypothetical protein JXA28_07350 [Bacteroidetes bacterium]|nr:hypothetical protein [Bacteroidota bacterium]